MARNKPRDTLERCVSIRGPSQLSTTVLDLPSRDDSPNTKEAEAPFGDIRLLVMMDSFSLNMLSLFSLFIQRVDVDRRGHVSGCWLGHDGRHIQDPFCAFAQRRVRKSARSVRKNPEQVPVYKGECCTVEQTKQDLDAVVMDADVSVSPLQVRPSPTGESIQTEFMELHE